MPIADDVDVDGEDDVDCGAVVNEGGDNLTLEFRFLIIFIILIITITTIIIESSRCDGQSGYDASLQCSFVVPPATSPTSQLVEICILIITLAHSSLPSADLLL